MKVALGSAISAGPRSFAHLFAAFPGSLIHHSRHILRLFFGVIAAVVAFGAVFVEPDHNPMKLDHGTPIVSGLALVFGFGFAFDHTHLAQQVGELSKVRCNPPRLVSRGCYITQNWERPIGRRR
jgi:hypothetical protein